MARGIPYMGAMLASLMCLSALAATPAITTTVPFPGSGHDFNMTIALNGNFPNLTGYIEAAIADELALTVESPEGTFTGAPYLLAAKSFVPGGIPFPGLDEHHHVPIQSAEIVSDVSSSNSFGTPVVSGGGSTVTLKIPPGLAGTNWMFQAFSTDPADGSILATSDGIEVHIVN